MREETKKAQSERETEEAATHAKHEAYEEKLLNDAEAARAEGSTNSDLSLTHVAPREKQARHVDARDDPEKCRSSEERQKSAANFRLNKRCSVVADVGRGDKVTAVRICVLRSDLLLQSADVGLCRLQGCRGVEPCYHGVERSLTGAVVVGFL